MNWRELFRAATWYTVVAALLFGLASALDAAAAAGGAEPMRVLWALGLGLGAGAVLGLVLGVALQVMFSWRAAPRALVWLVLGGACSRWLIQQLGILQRLGGAYGRIALLSLVASLALGLGIVALGLALQPTSKHPASWLRERRGGRVVGAVLAGVAALACIWLDRFWMAGEYAAIQAALRWTGLAMLLALGYLLLPRELGSSRAWRWQLAALALLPLLTLVGLKRADDPALPALAARPYSSLALTLLRRLLDLDRDGASALLGGGDCNDWSREVGPARAELPDNGRDDNCLLGDAHGARTKLDPRSIPTPAGPAPLSVVLLTVDALSAAHVSGYGYRRKTTPNIDRWATESAVTFERAYSPSAGTALSFSSLFRGVYPRRLSWTALFKTTQQRLVPASSPGLRESERIHSFLRLPLHEPRPPLSWWLHRRGVSTFAVTTAEWLRKDHRIVGDFDTHLDLRAGSAGVPDREVTARALELLAKTSGEQRFFLWAHYFGPHAPSTRHPDLPAFGPTVEDQYDHEILAFDRDITPVLDELGRRQRAGERLLVILTADHGEELGKRSRYHGFSVAEPLVRVPLLLAMPGLAPGRSPAVVSTIDAFATILAATETEGPADSDARDLRTTLLKPQPGRVVLSETWSYDGLGGDTLANQLLATDGELRLTRNLSLATSELGRVRDAQNGFAPNLLGQRHAPNLSQALQQYLEQTCPVEGCQPP